MDAWSVSAAEGATGVRRAARARRETPPWRR